MEADKNPIPELDILPHPIRAIGRAVLNFCSMKQLASHGDHFVNPLDQVFDEEPYEQQSFTWYYPEELNQMNQAGYYEE